jgi:hypothetical protein
MINICINYPHVENAVRIIRIASMEILYGLYILALLIEGLGFVHLVIHRPCDCGGFEYRVFQIGMSVIVSSILYHCFIYLFTC